MAVGLPLLSTLGSGTPPIVAALVLAVFQLGVAPLVTLGNNLIIGSAPPQAAGQASGTSQTFNELGGALGIAVLGSIGTALYRGGCTGATAGLPGADARAVHDTLARAASVAGHLPPHVIHTAQTAFTHGMSIVALDHRRADVRGRRPAGRHPPRVQRPDGAERGPGADRRTGPA